MQWIDGKEIDFKQYSGESLCEKMALEMWNCGCDIEQYPDWADFIQVPYFIIAFDTELTMEGIFTFLENSIGHYAPQIIQAFRTIGDDNDADILEEICTLCPPDIVRGEFLENNYQEYEITCFNENHELKEDIAERIAELSKKLYLNTDFDMWELLFRFVDRKIAERNLVQNMNQNFILQGNRSHIRMEDELLSIDKKAADLAFKKYNKEILGNCLKEQGFYKWKTNSYVRRNNIDLLEYIDLQKERYGSKTFTVNFAIMPLYIPTEYMVTGFGKRLGTFITGKDVWWDYADDNAARISFQNVTDAVCQFVLPWFEQLNDENCYRGQLKKKNTLRTEQWLDAIDTRNDNKHVIAENVERLKLPKKLL